MDLLNDPEAAAALKKLIAMGYSLEEIQTALAKLNEAEL